MANRFLALATLFLAVQLFAANAQDQIQWWHDYIKFADSKPEKIRAVYADMTVTASFCASKVLNAAVKKTGATTVRQVMAAEKMNLSQFVDRVGNVCNAVIRNHYKDHTVEWDEVHRRFLLPLLSFQFSSNLDTVLPKQVNIPTPARAPAVFSAPAPERQISFCSVSGTLGIDQFVERALECRSNLINADATVVYEQTEYRTLQEVANGMNLNLNASRSDSDKAPSNYLYEVAIEGAAKVGPNYRFSGVYSVTHGGMYQGYNTGTISPERVRHKREACGVQLAVRTATDLSGRTANIHLGSGERYKFRVADECRAILEASTMCRIWNAVADRVKADAELRKLRPAECN